MVNIGHRELVVKMSKMQSFTRFLSNYKSHTAKSHLDRIHLIELIAGVSNDMFPKIHNYALINGYGAKATCDVAGWFPGCADSWSKPKKLVRTD